MHELIKEVFLKNFKTNFKIKKDIDVPLNALDDSGVIDGIVFTTDSHTVSPIFFPGGDIGSLAVAGTINDIAVMGAKPIALSSAFVIEEGFAKSDMERIVKSMAETSKLANVPIITGDTKVVEAKKIDKIVINTSGIGKSFDSLEKNMGVVKKYRKNLNSKWTLDSNLMDGDKLILSGTVGDHGIAIISSREDYGFETNVKSDVFPLNKMIEKCLDVGGITAMKDPTRGGIANALNEWSEKSNIGIIIEEEKIPISAGVRSACEFLGLDPLTIGNEGKVLIGCVEDMADEILSVLRKTKEGKNAEIIGTAKKNIKKVVMDTIVGGRRIIEAPSGDPIPRIC